MKARSTLVFSPGAAGPLVEDADPSWRDLAECQYSDPELWFPEKGGSVKAAKRICAACPVQAECLEYALGTEELFGVWGGLSTKQRRRLLDARYQEREAAEAAQRAALDERAAQAHPDGYKNCLRCGPKPLAGFNYKSAASDGLSYWCKDCNKKDRETRTEHGSKTDLEDAA